MGQIFVTKEKWEKVNSANKALLDKYLFQLKVDGKPR
jgi:hypothetical protein